MSSLMLNNDVYENDSAHSSVNGDQTLGTISKNTESATRSEDSPPVDEKYQEIWAATSESANCKDQSIESHKFNGRYKPKSEQKFDGLAMIVDCIPNVVGHEQILLDALWAMTLPKGPHAEQTFKGTQWTDAYSVFIAPSLTERSNAWLSTPISKSVRDELVRDRIEGLPELNAHGRLPPGIYHTTFKQLVTLFATNSYRTSLVEHLEITLRELRDAGVREVVIGGSFVSSTPYPGDIDMVYVRNANINQYALINALWKANEINIHAWAADREHMPIAGQPFDPTRRFSFLQFLQTYQEKCHRRTGLGREIVGVVYVSLDHMD